MRGCSTTIFAPIVIACCVSACGQEPTEFTQLDLQLAVSKIHDASVRQTPLLIHFHGAAEIIETNFHRSGLSGVLVTVNCRGLSSAYRRPFENRELFPFVLGEVRRQLVSERKCDGIERWSRIDVSCFSAGYGAVRELLKDEETRRQIASVTAADSIYASIRDDKGRRVVDKAEMAPFLAFTQLAIQGKKSFLVSHSQLPVVPYASTVETADFLLEQTGLIRDVLEIPAPKEFQPTSQATRGNFTVLGYPGSNGEAHLNHLRHISALWSHLRDIR